MSRLTSSLLLVVFFFFLFQINRELFIIDFFQNYIKPGWAQFLNNVYRNKQESSVSVSLRFDGRFPKGSHVTKTFFQINYKASSFFSPFSVSDRPKFLAFSKKKKKKKKSNDVVKPFFTWNNSFNLKNEHITA